MITYLRGRISDSTASSVTLDVNGIGFGIQVPEGHQFTIKTEAELFIYMHWNQEQGPQLYGFTSHAQKAVFTLILSASGLGPKIGLTILSQLSPAVCITALINSDSRTLSSISGIGPKKAESMIMQLKDKAAKLAQTGIIENTAPLTTLKKLNDVLVSLNYSRPEITNALEHVKKTISLDQTSFDNLLRSTLAVLSKK